MHVAHSHTHGVNLGVDQKQQARAAFNKKGEEVAKALEEYLVPDEKIQSVVDYCIGTLCNNPQMKIKRIVRKAVEHFKLQKK